MRHFLAVVLCFATLFVSTFAHALPPTLVFKNQFGEQTNANILSGTFASGKFLLATESVIAAGALSTTVAESLVSNVTAGSIAVTLAAPSSQDGQIKVILAVAMMTHTVTLALTNVKLSGGYTPTGTTTLTFTNAGDCAVFMALGAKWIYLGGSAIAS